MIYLKAYMLISDNLLMIHRYFELLMTLMNLLLNLIMIGYKNGFINGKCLLILTELNQLMKLYSLEKLKILFTLIFILTTCQLLKQHLKCTWDFNLDAKLYV